MDSREFPPAPNDASRGSRMGAIAVILVSVTVTLLAAAAIVMQFVGDRWSH